MKIDGVPYKKWGGRDWKFQHRSVHKVFFVKLDFLSRCIMSFEIVFLSTSLFIGFQLGFHHSIFLNIVMWQTSATKKPGCFTGLRLRVPTKKYRNLKLAG